MGHSEGREPLTRGSSVSYRTVHRLHSGLQSGLGFGAKRRGNHWGLGRVSELDGVVDLDRAVVSGSIQGGRASGSRAVVEEQLILARG
jgi:hypothetical protein